MIGRVSDLLIAALPSLLILRVEDGIDSRIVHLVVWTKFELEDDSATGLLSHQARDQVEQFVDRTFREAVPPAHVSRDTASLPIITNDSLGCLVQEHTCSQIYPCPRTLPRIAVRPFACVHT
jgi:hypothetical protein